MSYVGGRARLSGSPEVPLRRAGGPRSKTPIDRLNTRPICGACPSALNGPDGIHYSGSERSRAGSRSPRGIQNPHPLPNLAYLESAGCIMHTLPRHAGHGKALPATGGTSNIRDSVIRLRSSVCLFTFRIRLERHPIASRLLAFLLQFVTQPPLPI